MKMRKSTGVLALSALALTIWSSPLNAQEAGVQVTGIVPSTRVPLVASDSSVGKLVGAGLLGGLAGVVGGAILGYRLERSYWPCTCDDPGWAGLIVGGAVGSALAVPTAVHFANHRQGSLGMSMAAAGVVAALGLFAFEATGASDAGVLTLLGAPLVQVALSVAIERSAKD